MLTFPRSLVRSLRTVRRGCGPRGPAPPVLIVPGADGVTAVMHFNEVVVAYHMAGPYAEAEPFLLALDHLDDPDGAGDEPVTLTRREKGWAELLWAEGGRPSTRRVEIHEAEARHAPPRLPDEWVPMPGDFLRAVHEAVFSCRLLG